MAASSHDAGVRSLPYNAFQSNPDKHHLYASLTSWASPHTLSQPSPSSSLMFQRPGTATQHQPTNLSHYSGPLDYSTLPSEQPWSSYRPETLREGGFSSRPAEQYGYTGPPPLSRVRDLLHAPPQDHLASTPRGQESQLTTYAAPPDTHTFLRNGAGPASTARHLNHPPGAAGTQMQASHFASPHAPVNWTAQSNTGVEAPNSHDYQPSHSSVAYSSALIMVPTAASSNVSSWGLAGGDAGVPAGRAFERPYGLASDWAPVEARTEHGTHNYRVAQTTPISPLDSAQYAHSMSLSVAPPSDTGRAPYDVATQINRRPGASQKLPTMPSPFVERQKKNTVSKRHGPLSKEKRDKAHRMRKRGPDRKPPCIRCRFYKAGCDEGDPCAKCEKTSKSARVFHLPCCRDQIEDTNLVRRCNGRWNQAEAEFLKYPWRNDCIQYMDIIWNLPGFGPVAATQPFRIKFREYEPEGSISDSTESQWLNTTGQLVKVEQPPYAVFDTAALQHEVEDYFTRNLPAVDQWIFGRNRHDEIALLTYREALRLRYQGGPGSELLNLALQLQALSVVSQGYGSVWSTNIPGIKQYDFRAMGHSVYEAYDRNSCDRPLPIAINHQMDVAFVKYLKRLEEKCFKLLAKEIFKTGIRPWYELFLTLFVLFWNLEYIHSGAEGYIKSKYGTHIARQVSNVVSQQIERWDFSFEVLMNHWQGCLRGFKPFVLARENPEELRNKGRLPDAIAFEYMTTMASILDQKGPNRFAPPMTGYAPPTNSMASKWIGALIKEAGG